MMTLLANLNFQAPSISLYDLVPILVLGSLLAAALCLEVREERPLQENETPAKPSVVGLGAIALAALMGYYLCYDGPRVTLSFNDMLFNDPLSRASGLLITVCALLAILAGPDELERFRNSRGGEFCALIFSASLGMIMMSSAASTMVMFLGLELFSIALYLLCIFFPERPSSRESGMKYFFLSSAASAVLLYGLALLYGATGTTWIPEMLTTAHQASSGLALAGGGLVLSGLLFKLAIVPFHFWAPDVYEGAPTTVTAFMSVATKIAALAALWRIVEALPLQAAQVSTWIMFSLAALSMLVGNFMALAQTSVKRMLAYSGIGNAGYLLIAPIIGHQMAGEAGAHEMLVPMLFFLAAYLAGNTGAFLALAQVESLLKKNIERKDLGGLFYRSPWLAGCFALCLVSLAGLPPAAGFMAKFFLFGRALSAGEFVLPVVGIVGSLIGVGYYLGTAVCLFTRPTDESEVAETEQDTPTTSRVALAICVAGVLYLGLMPGSFMAWLASPANVL
jgi:NADH-quinone oxidoreductase subunit N